MAFNFSLLQQFLLELLLLHLNLYLLPLELRLFDSLELFFVALGLRNHWVNSDHIDPHLLDLEVLFLHALHENLLVLLLPFLGLYFLTFILSRRLTSLLFPQKFLLILRFLFQLNKFLLFILEGLTKKPISIGLGNQFLGLLLVL